MSKQNKTPEEKEVSRLLGELQELQSEKNELSDYVDEKFEKQRAEQFACKARIEEALQRIDEIEAEIRETDPQVFKDLATAEREIAHKEAEVKHFCHRLSVSKYKGGAVFRGSGLKVKVSRSTIRREYKPELLKQHPELEHMYVDGDPVVVRSINAAVLDRLVAEEKFDADVAKEFLLEEKMKNPQVRIRTADDEEDDETR